MDTVLKRVFCAIGGLFGVMGVAAYAASSHIDGYYGNIAPILLTHAPILVFLALHRHIYTLGRLGGTLILIGVLLFTFGVMFPQWFGVRLFPSAAPIGGTAIMLGWLCLGLMAFCPRSTVADDEN